MSLSIWRNWKQVCHNNAVSPASRSAHILSSKPDTPCSCSLEKLTAVGMEITQLPKPHLVVIPSPITSHIIPAVDIGCLLAAHGAPVTIITTPASAELVQGRVHRAGQGSSAGITVTAIPFPAAEAGLPDGCERLDHVPSADLLQKFFDAVKLFGEAVAQHCCRLMAPRRPSCIVAGMCNTWAHAMARQLGAPCFIFYGHGAFSSLCFEYLHTHRPQVAVASLDEPFDVPVLPPFEVKFTRRQLPVFFQQSSNLKGGILRGIREFDMAVDGIVVNSFEELQRDSAARLAAATGKAVLAVGPVSLCGAGTGSCEATRCVAWLDTKKAKSVLYVSFGSNGRMPPAQLMQLGPALVSCPWPVLWVIKGADTLPDHVNEWLQHNTDGDGHSGPRQCLVVRGWAPQVPILEHPAVGGFLTHCGWDSTLESVAAGVPMATWPFFAEQFMNEKLIVDVLGIGVSVGVTKPTENLLNGVKGEVKAEVGTEQVKRALNKLMDGGAQGEDRRSKARELKAKAKAALENGGSSYMNLEKLIQFAA